MYASSLIRSAIFMLLAFSLLGCGKADLSRSSAKDMIQGSPELKALSQNVRLNSAAASKAHALDVLNGNGALTPKGAKFFSRFSDAGATLAQPISLPDVEVTGITSVPMAEDMKEVQFNLTFQYPPVIKRFATKVSGGVAQFRRYDDGWRLEKVNISASNEPYPLTAQEASDEQVETLAVAIEQAKRIAAFVYTDKKTGLIWRRCVEGMVYSGDTCTGAARHFTFNEALQHAAAEASRTGLGWRVPVKDELASIIDQSHSNQAIDTTTFPATPLTWFWSATREASYGRPGAWMVNFMDGHINSGTTSYGNTGHVRLVRTGQ